MDKLNWVMNDFINKEFYAPFVVDKDDDYYKALQKKYKLFYEISETAGADKISLQIIKSYGKKDM